MTKIFTCRTLLLGAFCTILGCGDPGFGDPGFGDPDFGDPPRDMPRQPESDWGVFVKMLDGPSDYEGPPVDPTPEVAPGPSLERGALVYAKVVVGGAEVRSSDPTIFTVGQVETREVGEICERDDRLDCRADFDTWFMLLGHAVGDAELIVEGTDRGTRRLPLSVGERASASFRYVATGLEEADGPRTEPVNEIVLDGVLGAAPSSLFLGVFEFEQVELVARDAEGVRLLSHATWTLTNTEAVQFLDAAPGSFFYDIPSEPTSDAFVGYEVDRFEGPYPFLWPVEEGETVLSVETTGGLEMGISVRSLVAEGSQCNRYEDLCPVD